MRSRILFIVALLALSLMWATAPAAAISTTVLSFNVTCEYFEVTFSDVIFDRDNTGSEVETYSGIITDGIGNVIEFFQNAEPVGTVLPAGTDAAAYQTPPLFNPIRFVLYSDAGNGLPQQLVWDLSGDCPGLPTAPTPPASGFTGAGIPADYVMHYIACTTPVYTEPAGVPVGNDRVLEGQTWFVAPEPVTGADGQLWTEIFVGSFINPWIPTDCVGGVAPLTG